MRELLPSRSQRGGFEVPLIPPNIIRPQKVWVAHNLSGDSHQQGRNAIVGLQLIEQPNSILVTSQNGTATIWGLDPRPTKAEELKRYEDSLSKSELTEFRKQRRAKRMRRHKEMWLAGMTEDEIHGRRSKRGAEEKEEEIEREKPVLLGVLDPDINRSTPDWKFSLDIMQRERDKILEARKVLQNAVEAEREDQRKAERQKLAAAILKGSEDSVTTTGTDSAKLSKKHTRSNPLDFQGHDFVEQALNTAFGRHSNRRNDRGTIDADTTGKEGEEDDSDGRGALSPVNHDFSSRSSGLTADMLAGRSGASGGAEVEMMAWRRKAAASKKNNRDSKCPAPVAKSSWS